MINRVFVVDVLIAAAVAVVALLVLSGVALAGAVAVVVLLLCGVTLLVDRWRGRHAARAGPRAPGQTSRLRRVGLRNLR